MNNKLTFHDFTFYHFEDDENFNDELYYKKGLKEVVALNFEKDLIKNVKQYQYDSVEVLKSVVKNILKTNEGNFIVGLNNFKIDLNQLDRFQTSYQLFDLIKDEWKYFAKKCMWQYSAVVKLDGSVYLIESELETHIHYPIHDDNLSLFKLLVMPNTIKHFVHFSDLSEEEKHKIPPKIEVFRRIENYFLNHFHNCICFSLNDFLKK